MRNISKKQMVAMIVAGLATVLMVVATILVAVLPDGNLANVTFEVAPASATIKIDGKEYAYKHAVLTKGLHTIEVEKFGFETETEFVEIEGDTTVSVVLTPNMTFTTAWYLENPADAKLYEEVLAHREESEREELLAEYPELEKLPVSGAGFSIDLEPCTRGYEWEAMCVKVAAEDYYASKAALEYFRNNIDAEMGEYYFFYAGQPSAFDWYESFSADDLPEPTHFLSDSDEYAVAVFLTEGLLYRVLFVNDGAGNFVVAGNPAPVLAYDNFLSVPQDVIRAANKIVPEV